jgi:2-keto-4-pentenoate hydratase/2-oxohepta-3-ene-1,7-dioic acid hydratase in catechol pathway
MAVPSQGTTLEAGSIVTTGTLEGEHFSPSGIGYTMKK